MLVAIKTLLFGGQHSPLQTPTPHSRSMAFHYKDLLRLSATELQHLLGKQVLTSVELVKECLAQIERHNNQGLQLQAVISTAPSSLLLDAAAELDAERAKGTLRGPFHGIPILIKVCRSIPALMHTSR